jgi:hypothetical protein
MRDERGQIDATVLDHRHQASHSFFAPRDRAS